MPDPTSSLEALLGRQVVLDSAGPITWVGTLVDIRPDGFWLESADLRDQTEGHDTKEAYICEARTHGIRPNRRRIFVFSNVVVSISALEDIAIH